MSAIPDRDDDRRRAGQPRLRLVLGAGPETSRMHELAERRLALWREIAGGPIEDRDSNAKAVRALTVALNGHARDVDRYATGKSSYFGDDGGQWADLRRARWEALGRAHPPAGPNLELDALIRSNGHIRNGGRVTRWRNPKPADSRGGGFDSKGNVKTTLHEPVGESKKYDLSTEPEVADLLGAGGDKQAHIDKGYGGEHDLVWLAFYGSSPAYELEEYRDVLHREGRPPTALMPVREDAMRVIHAMARAGVSGTATAELLGCSRWTIQRALETAPHLPIGGGASLEPPPNQERVAVHPDLLERLDRIERKQDELLVRMGDDDATAREVELLIADVTGCGVEPLDEDAV